MDTKTRVLLVEDDPAIRHQLTTDLTQRGFDAEAAEDGITALERLAAADGEGRLHDQVVTGIQLPDIDGLKLLSIIRSRHPSLPVVVISNHGHADTAEVVRRRRRATFLPKPVDADALIAAFEALAAAGDEGADTAGPGWKPPTAYVFVQLTKDADPEDVFTTLFAMEGVQRVDAVRGSADVVIRMDHPEPAAIDAFVRDKVGAVPGVAAARVRHVGTPELPPSVRPYVESYERRLPEDLLEPGRATLYAVVEIAPSTMPRLFPQLYFIDEVVEIAAIAGGEAVVLLLQAGDFNRIRTLLNDKVRYTDGVLRIDELLVVDMFGLGDDDELPDA